MIEVEHEGRQLRVGAALMLVTVVIETFGVVVLQESVERIRDPDAAHMTRGRVLAVIGTKAAKKNFRPRSVRVSGGRPGGVLRHPCRPTMRHDDELRRTDGGRIDRRLSLAFEPWRRRGRSKQATFKSGRGPRLVLIQARSIIMITIDLV
jgi:hypothetical protein